MRHDLKSGFGLYLAQPASLLDIAARSECIKEYLVALSYHSELVKGLKRTMQRQPNQTHIFARLVYFYTVKKYSLDAMVACLMSTMEAYDELTPFYKHVSALLYGGGRGLNAAKSSLMGIIGIQNCDLTELQEFMLQAFALMCVKMGVEVKIQTQSLANAPSIRKGILDCISFTAKSAVDG